MDGGEYVSMAGEFNDLKRVLISLLAILHSDTLMCNYYMKFQYNSLFFC